MGFYDTVAKLSRLRALLGRPPARRETRRRPLQVEPLEERVLLVAGAFLQGTAFLDADGNGQLNKGEPRLAGAIVRLFDTSGTTLLGQTSTDANGYYRFDDSNVSGHSLLPGAYRLAEAPPSGYANEAVQALGPLDPVSGRTASSAAVQVLDPSNLALSFDGPAYAQSVSVTYRGTTESVYATQLIDTLSGGGLPGPVTFDSFCADLDHNVQAGNTYPIVPEPVTSLAYNGGRVGYLYNHYGAAGLDQAHAAGLQLAIWELETDPAPDLGSGNFIYNNPDPGILAAANGYLSDSAGQDESAVFLAAPSGGQGMLAGGSVNFADAVACSIAGTVYSDGNQNGTHDTGEAGLGGVAVALEDASGAVVATTTSAADGSYQFTGLLPGTYSVRAVTPSGYTPGLPTAGSAGGTPGNDSVSTAAGQLVSRAYPVTVNNGQLDLRLKGPGGASPNAVIEDLEVTPGVPAPGLAYDFGTTFSPVAAGYSQITEATSYSAARGYGWLPGGDVQSLDRGVGTTLTSDLNYTLTQATFAVDLANGTYTVTLQLGDTVYAHQGMGVSFQGTQVDDLSNAAGEVFSKSYVVTVTNGQLDLGLAALGGLNTAAVIEGMEITSGRPSQFDFGPATSPLATGYAEATEGTAYSSAAGFGWLPGGGVLSYNRGGGTDLTSDFCYTVTQATFAVDLPNGTYSVTLQLGDTAYAHQGMGISFQGQLVDNVSNQAGQILSKTYMVTVSNGQLDLGLSALGGLNTAAVIEGMEIVAGSPPVQYDFGTVGSPDTPGFAGVTEATTYSAATHFGWLAGGDVQSLDRGVGTTLTSDLNYTLTQATFAVDLPNGTYVVTLQLGDTAYPHEGMGISFQGQQVDDLSSAAGQIITKTYTVTVGNGQLDLGLAALGGLNTAAVIEGMEIAPLAPPVARFDFGTPTSPVAGGYTRVTDATTYGAVQGYGWRSGTVTSLDTGSGDPLTRDANATPDGTFAVDLPNGPYLVHLTLGNPGPSPMGPVGVFLQGNQTTSGIVLGPGVAATGYDFGEVGAIHLIEQTNFLTEYTETLTLPAHPSALAIHFSDLLFDTTDHGRIKDAFELALVDVQGRPLAATTRQGRDAFFSATEGQAPLRGAATQYDPTTGTVTVDVSNLAPGSTATLIARLVNDDHDTTTQVTVFPDVQFVTSPFVNPSTSVPFAPAGLREPIDPSHLGDVTPSVSVSYQATTFNDATNLLRAGVTLDVIRNSNFTTFSVPACGSSLGGCAIHKPLP